MRRRAGGEDRSGQRARRDTSGGGIGEESLGLTRGPT
jgi:hypothetical protein